MADLDPGTGCRADRCLINTGRSRRPWADAYEFSRVRRASHVAAGRRSAARTRDGHGRQASPCRALRRLAEVHAVQSAFLVGGRAALAPMHPATEQARMQEQARRRRHLKNPAPPLSSSAVQWRAVPEKLRRPIGNRWTLIKRTQSGTGPLLPVRPGLQRVPLAPVVVCAAARA